MASAAPKQQEKQQKDVEMADAAPAAATNSSKPAAETPSVAAHTHLPPRPPAIQTANNDASAPPAPATATTDDLFGRTPTTAGVNNADFDSMFEDFANANDNGDAGGDASMGAGGGNDEFDFALLPGIESYANSDNNNASGSNPNKDNSTAAPEIDFSALDKAPSHNQAQEDEQKKKQEEEEKKKQEEEETRKKEEEEKKKKEEEEKQQQQDNQDLNEVFQGDSTFDDLFNYTDFDMGGAGGSTGGGDTTFDDDFFNI
ncbi:hypothetical protein MPH_02257 [Macrophomina phaseolina MS6]|uniref:Uncharacterized protein n=1 Tax=Macrophomina phaseolina (strain MS6) TaxID=1126212 RepID=K2S616_MACPH|nr:hypothetical protein MPH_02257 [Macrophomina phaseolina MS6]